MFGGLRGMTKLPDALFIVDPKQEKGAVAEAIYLKIPTIALMNSDCNREEITYPIPGNDASLQNIEFILDEVAKTYADHLAAPAPAESLSAAN